MKDLNLVPKSYYLKKKEKIKLLYKRLLIGAITSIVVLAFAIPLIIKLSLTIQLDNIGISTKESGNLEELDNQFSEIKRLCNDREKEALKINEVTKNDKTQLVLEKLEASKSNKLFLISSNISAEDTSAITITLNGIAESKSEIAQFVTNLKKQICFTEIEIKNVIQLEDDCNFVVKAKVPK